MRAAFAFWLALAAMCLGCSDHRSDKNEAETKLGILVDGPGSQSVPDSQVHGRVPTDSEGGSEPQTEKEKAIAKKGAIRLLLAKASAEKEPQGDIIFRCEAVLVNETGSVVNVKSNFYSAFDGLQLVVFRSDGSKLAQQSYLYHQSPYTSAKEGALFPLNIGENRKSLLFPVFSTVSLPEGVNKAQVLLVGMLPGTEDCSTLCSNIVTVSLSEKRKGIEPK